MRSGKKGHQKQGSTRIIGAHGRAVDNSAEFHATFSAQFLQRYADLFQALAAPVQHVALINSFTTVNDREELGLTERVCQAGLISCYRFPEAPTSYPPPPSCPYTQLKQFYWLDFASVLPPLLLGVQPRHVVLDMCAAPGGKSLVLAMQLLLGQTQTAAAEDGGVGDAAEAAASQGLLTPEMLQQLHLIDEGQQHVDQQQQQQQPAVSLQQKSQPSTAAAAGGGGGQSAEQQHDEPALQAVGAIGATSTNGTAANGTASPPGDTDQTTTAAAAAAEGVAGSDGEGGEEEGEEEDWPPATSSSSSSSAVGRLVCNELDPVRRHRLSGVLASYLPGSMRRRVRITGNDGAKHWARFEGGLYDRVLLDAPCSSERHVVQAALEAGGVVSSSSWSKEHCNNLAALQLKLLLAGLRALKPGGRLVYSTCSMASAENDDVVQQALQQSKGSVTAVPVQEWGVVGSEQVMQIAGAELTEHGMICLPDKAGWGPIYVCLLQKQEV